MKTATKKEKPPAASRVSTKAVSQTKKTTEKSGKSHVGACSHTRHIKEIKTLLGILIAPDFSSGKDYYLKVDHRLFGHLPDLFHKIRDVLDAHYSGKKC